MKKKNFIFIFIVTILLLSMNAQIGYCKWQDKSSELPGMGDGTVYLVAGGIILTGLVTYFIEYRRT